MSKILEFDVSKLPKVPSKRYPKRISVAVDEETRQAWQKLKDEHDVDTAECARQIIKFIILSFQEDKSQKRD